MIAVIVFGPVSPVLAFVLCYSLSAQVREARAVQSAGFIWLFLLTFASSAFVQTENVPAPSHAFAELAQKFDSMSGSWIACMRNLLPEREKR